MLVGRLIPGTGTVTALGMTILFIFIGALYGWITVGMGWPSIVALIMLGLTEYSGYSVATVFTSAISNPVVQLLIWLFAFAAILTTSGLPEALVNRLVAAKFVKGKPWRLTIIIIMASFLASLCSGPFTGIIICWEFINAITKELNLTKNDKWPGMAICGVVFATSIGGTCLPFNGATVAGFGYLSAAAGTTMTYNYATYTVFALIFGLAIMAMYFVFCKFIIKPDMSMFSKNISIGEIKPFTMKQKIAVWSLVGLVVLTFIPSFLPTGGLKTFINQFGTIGMVFVIICVTVFLKDKEGKTLFDLDEICKSGISFNMMFMMACAIVLGTALASADSGIQTFLVNTLQPMFSGMSPYLFMFLFLCASMLVTNLINNGVTCAIMIPLAYSLGTSFGINMAAITVLICFIANVGLLLPSSSAYGAMLRGKTEWISGKEFYKEILLFIMGTLIVTAVIGIPLANALL
jgi:sodium-dependent dicarboxylate transporter 2/3/5